MKYKKEVNLENSENANLNQRDYDKESIVIKDYNPIFQIISFCVAVFPMIIYFGIYGDKNTFLNIRNYIFFVFPFFVLPILISNFKSLKNTIKFTDEKILYFSDEEIIEEISLDKITEIKKTIDARQNKSQKMPSYVKYLLLFLFCFFGYLAFTQNIKFFFFGATFCFFGFPLFKYGFHFYKDKAKSYELFDNFIFFENDKFINVMPINTHEKSEIENFISEKFSLKSNELNKTYFIYGNMLE
ncbi:hypothetical protein F1B92_08620 [Campylobacter sp. FMV-PI01]|uniref:Uncharacterized protein n=1 Tax=Campylobacter portucalensis TaxID=2608384 RepID=A0A6L5WIV6_9BACT|nr:hypothetical protein [Campylobacter portucalensis]MSN97218.1 hypothetical protein [Campylobacter portucalensis]